MADHLHHMTEVSESRSTALYQELLKVAETKQATVSEMCFTTLQLLALAIARMCPDCQQNALEIVSTTLPDMVRDEVDAVSKLDKLS